MTVYLETERLILRDWEEEDLVHFARINSDPIIMEYYPSRLDEAASVRLAAHFQDHIVKHGYGFYAVEHKGDGAFVGFSGLSQVPGKMPFAPAVELAWRLDYGYWGKGYGSEVTRALLAHGFGALGLEEIIAYCTEGNVRAQALLAKIGFTHDIAGDFAFALSREVKDKQDYQLYKLASGHTG